MRFAAIFFALSATCFAAQPDEDAIKKELKLFQGKWSAVSAQGFDGKPVPDDELKAASLVVDGDKFTFKSSETTIEGTFKIDPTKKSRQSTFSSATKRQKPLVLGVYEIKGDTRRSCFAEPERNGPMAFARRRGVHDSRMETGQLTSSGERDGLAAIAQSSLAGSLRISRSRGCLYVHWSWLLIALVELQFRRDSTTIISGTSRNISLSSVS